MKPALHSLAFGALLTVFATTALAANDDLSTMTYEGTLGAQRIGMTLAVRDGKVVPDSHYFYARHLQDISLTGTSGGEVALQEPGGGAFALHFKGNGSNGNAPLTFNNSVGLEGQWTGKDGKTFPVTLTNASEPGDAALPGARWYRDATDKSDTVFEAQVQGFYKAVLAGDRAGTARYVHFPLRVNVAPGKPLMVKDAAQLKAQWDRIFSPAWLKQAAQAMPHDMPVIRGQAMLGQGLAFFGDQGAEVINPQ
jgi:hypothetical protein